MKNVYSTVHTTQYTVYSSCAIGSAPYRHAAAHAQGPVRTYRVEWFLRGENGHLPSCGKLLLDPIYKLLPFKVAYFWGARPHKILPVTLKSATQNIIFNIIKGCTWSKMCSLVCLKAKTFLKILAFTMLLILGDENIFLTKLNSKFSSNKLKFLRPLWFFEFENFANFLKMNF